MKPTATLFTLTLLCAAALAHGADCDPYTRQDPGGDYTNADDRRGLPIVEKFHFMPDVERLNLREPGPDLDYTLRHFPNHHRALAAMAKLGLRDKTGKPNGATYSIICYFDRAIRFKPDDAKVRMIYGAYLMALNQPELALEQLRESSRLSPDNPTVNYNLGLMYLKRKDYAQARLHAKKAYDLGFPLQGLKNKLSAAGQWDAGLADAAPVTKDPAGQPQAAPEPDAQAAAGPGPVQQAPAK